MGGLQQEFGVRQYAEADADVRQQAHRLHVVRRLAQELAAEVFRLEQFALADQVENDDQRLRQPLEVVQLRLYLCRLSAAAKSGQDVELAAPAGHQRRIEPARPRIGAQRFLGPPHVAKGMAFLLVRPAVFGREGLQFPELCQGLVEFAPVTPADRAHVERVGVFRLVLQDDFQIAQRFPVSFGNDPCLDRSQFGLARLILAP